MAKIKTTLPAPTMPKINTTLPAPTTTNVKNYFPISPVPRPAAWSALIEGTTRICDRYNLPGRELTL
jgi:hypothetical protein